MWLISPWQRLDERFKRERERERALDGWVHLLSFVAAFEANRRTKGERRRRRITWALLLYNFWVQRWGLMQQRISKVNIRRPERKREREAGMNQTNQPGHIFRFFLFLYIIFKCLTNESYYVEVLCVRQSDGKMSLMFSFKGGRNLEQFPAKK